MKWITAWSDQNVIGKYGLVDLLVIASHPDLKLTLHGRNSQPYLITFRDSRSEKPQKEGMPPLNRYRLKS